MQFKKLSDQEILDIVKPLAEHTENAWNKKDYHSFCRYLLEDDPEHRFTEENFNYQLEKSYHVYGYHTIADLVTLHRNPENVIAIWKVNFEKRKEPGLLMYEFQEHEDEILICGCSYHA